MLSGRTRLLGVIGHPIGHSLSPRMHNASLAQPGVEGDGADYVYVAMDVPPERLQAAVRGLVALGFVGFNVTMPHKEAILPLMDELDASARLAGAVNTVVVEGGKLHGLNTDGSGFVEACEEAGVPLAGRRILILGAGGAAAAIAVAALGAGASWLCIANRTLEKAEELLRRLSEVAPGAKTSACPLERAARAAAGADILVNATYLGMKKEDPLPLPAEALGAQKVVSDAVYLPGGEETALIRSACKAGARTVPGERMLLYQGVQAQRVWTGREPNVKAMSDALTG